MSFDISALIREGAQIQRRIRSDRSRLAEIHQALLAIAEFKAGCATGHVVNDEYDVKISRKFTVKYDQEKLEQVRAIFKENFTKFFVEKVEYAPINQSDVEHFIEMYTQHPAARCLKEAMTKKEGAPSVTYTFIGK